MSTRAARRLTFAANLLLALVAAVSLGIAANTHDAPEGGWLTSNPAFEKPAKPSNIPTWETHGGAKGCQSNERGVLADTVLVVTMQGEVERMAFDDAWAATQDDTSVNDLWIIGTC